MLQDKVIAIYCLVDDLLKEMNHKEHGNRIFSDGQVIATALVSALYFRGNQTMALCYMDSLELKVPQEELDEHLRKVRALSTMDKPKPYRKPKNDRSDKGQRGITANEKELSAIKGRNKKWAKDQACAEPAEVTNVRVRATRAASLPAGEAGTPATRPITAQRTPMHVSA